MSEQFDRIGIAMQCLKAVIDDEVADYVYNQNGNADKVMKVLQERYDDLADAISALRKSDD